MLALTGTLERGGTEWKSGWTESLVSGRPGDGRDVGRSSEAFGMEVRAVRYSRGFPFLRRVCFVLMISN